jgi:ribonuclease HI
MGNIRIYSDGFSSPHPNGAAAWAFVVYEGEKAVYSDKGLLTGGQISNIVAEYTALEKALLYIDENLPDEKVSLYVDSRLVLYQARGKWNAHAGHLIPFRNRCQTLYRENKGVRLYYCKPEENKADSLTQEVYQSIAGTETKKPPLRRKAKATAQNF